MSFIDALSDYLRQIELRSEEDVVIPAQDKIDPAFTRNVLIRCLERLDAEAAPESTTSPRRPGPQTLFAFWQQNDGVVRFSNELSRLLRESIWKNASGGEVNALVETAIARQLKLPDKLPSRIQTMELDRISDAAREVAFRYEAEQPVDRASYSDAIRAARPIGTRRGLTAVGRVFLELKGRDAIRWLLHVEAAQSFGPSDPWRVSRETAAHLVQKGSWSFWDGNDGESNFPHAWATVRRLAALGLVKISSDESDEYTDLQVLPMGYQLFSEIADEKATPMSVLANSILSDLTLSAAGAAVPDADKATARIESTAVAESNVRQSRLVAHEIRNMLVPVKTALGAFYREVQMAEHPGEVVTRRRDSIDRGIDSVFRFINQLVELSQFAAVPPEPFDTLLAIRDAVSAVESESGRRIEQNLPTQLPLLCRVIVLAS